MLVKVLKIEANPFRRLDHYKIIQEKVDELKNSISETTFWGGLLARENPNKKGFYQLAFGHHRIEAIRQLGIKEIDIQVRDIDDSLLLRMMANENLDTWKTTPAVINETVWAAKDFIEREIKGKKWSDLNKNIKILFDSDHALKQTQTHGVGQTNLLLFLGENWKQWMIQEALATIQDETIDREAVEEFPTTKQASTFRKAVKVYDVPKNKQKELAKSIIKEGRDSTREVKEAIKEKALEDKKSKALTVRDKKKIEEDMELNNLIELIESTDRLINKSNCLFSDLINKVEELEIIPESFGNINTMSLNMHFKMLLDSIERFESYLSFTVTVKEKNND